MNKIKSNVSISSNVMVIEPDKRMEYWKHVPGDYVGKIYKGLNDVRSIGELTERQKIERDQYLVCLECGKPCAGVHH